MGRKVTLLRLKSVLTTWSRQLTLPWLVSLVLLTTGIGFYLSFVMPARHELEKVKTHLSVMQHDEHLLVQTSQSLAHKAPTGQLEVLYQAFPFEKTVPDSIEQLINLAQVKGLNPKQAEYRIVRSNPGALLSYQITLPITGAYPKITTFVFDSLSKFHNLSLDDISFQRQKIGDNEVDAVLRMTLYIRLGQSDEH
jgi:hypothetical protein